MDSIPTFKELRLEPIYLSHRFFACRLQKKAFTKTDLGLNVEERNTGKLSFFLMYGRPRDPHKKDTHHVINARKAQV